jgi:restriction system protein
MLPVLEEVARRGECRTGDLVDVIAGRFALSAEERAALLPSGKQTVVANRTHWAVAYLGKTLLVERTRRAHYRITERGSGVLASAPPRIDLKFLERYPEFAAFRGESGRPEIVAAAATSAATAEATPDEVIRTAHRQIEAALRGDIVERILQRDPHFFETLVLKVLLAMGYGGGDPTTAEVVGGAGDEGVDVVVRQDPLGLDRVYVQAKRYARDRTVGPGTVHALAGSLGIFKASKGLLVTTAGFTRAARETAEKVANRVVLVDGDELAALMIRYGVGVRIEETFHVKKVDEDFFLE